MLGKTTIALSLALIFSVGAQAGPPDGKGKGGGGGGKDDEPSVPIDPVYVHSLSGKQPTIQILDKDFANGKTAFVMSDGRTRGMDHAPDEGRVLTEEHRTLYQTRYEQNADDSISVTSREVLHDGEVSANKVQCIATARGGRTAYSLTSTTSRKIRIFNPALVEHFFSGQIQSCDFAVDGSFIAAIENLPGSGFNILRIDLPSGQPQTLFTTLSETLELESIDVAPDGQSYLVSWRDRGGATTVDYVSEWLPGTDVFDPGSIIASDARGGSYLCEVVDNQTVATGYIYQSIAGREPVWIEATANGERELIASKGNRGIYYLRSTKC